MYLCMRCGGSFKRSIGEVNRGRIKFCSRQCSDLFKKESAIKSAENIIRAGKKQCKSCDKTLPLVRFPKSKDSLTGYFSYCIECRKLINQKADKKRWSKHREKLIIQRRNANYKKNFGISISQYEELLASQNGVCAICYKNNDKKLLHIDHSHNDGRIRGILCENCNRGIGMFKDDVNIMKSAIMYLSKAGND